jgi:alkylhydroperoxidase family enzyme
MKHLMNDRSTEREGECLHAGAEELDLVLSNAPNSRGCRFCASAVPNVLSCAAGIVITSPPTNCRRSIRRTSAFITPDARRGVYQTKVSTTISRTRSQLYERIRKYGLEQAPIVTSCPTNISERNA